MRLELEALLDEYAIPKGRNMLARVRHVLSTRRSLLALLAELIPRAEADHSSFLVAEHGETTDELAAIRDQLDGLGVPRSVALENGTASKLSVGARIDWVAAQLKIKSAALAEASAAIGLVDGGSLVNAITDLRKAADNGPTELTVSAKRYVAALYGPQVAEALDAPHDDKCEACGHPVHILTASAQERDKLLCVVAMRAMELRLLPQSSDEDLGQFTRRSIEDGKYVDAAAALILLAGGHQ